MTSHADIAKLQATLDQFIVCLTAEISRCDPRHPNLRVRELRNALLRAHNYVQQTQFPLARAREALTHLEEDK